MITYLSAVFRSRPIFDEVLLLLQDSQASLGRKSGHIGIRVAQLLKFCLCQ